MGLCEKLNYKMYFMQNSSLQFQKFVKTYKKFFSFYRNDLKVTHCKLYIKTYKYILNYINCFSFKVFTLVVFHIYGMQF